MKLNELFALPPQSTLSKRLTKAFFLDKVPLLSAEKRFLENTTNMTMQIVASLKPETTNVSVYEDKKESYKEVIIIAISFAESNFEALAVKCCEILQKYLPHHLLLIAYNDTHLMLNASTKRIAANDATKRVIEENYITAPIMYSYSTSILHEFLKQLHFAQLDKTNLKTLYQSYIRAIIAWQIAQVNNSYQVRDGKRSQEDVQKLNKIETLNQAIAGLQMKIKKEDRISEQIAINVRIKELKEEVKQLKEEL